MRILYELYVISNFHHNIVFLFVLRLDITIGPYMKSFIFQHSPTSFIIR